MRAYSIIMHSLALMVTAMILFVGCAKDVKDPNSTNTTNTDAETLEMLPAPIELPLPPSPRELQESEAAQRVLQTGWTMWTPDKQINDLPIAEAIDPDVLANINSIWAWSEAEAKWELFLNGYATPNDFLELTTLDSGRGYWIFSKAEIDIVLTGNPIENREIGMSGADWHLVGFGASGDMNDLEMLVTPDNNDPFCAWHFEGLDWKVACSDKDIATINADLDTDILQALEHFETGKAYWIKADSGTLDTTYPPRPFSLTEFVFPEQSRTFLGRFRSLLRAGIEELTTRTILDNGKTIVLHFKNGSGVLIPCAVLTLDTSFYGKFSLRRLRDFLKISFGQS